MKRVDVDLPGWTGEAVHVFEDSLTGALAAIAIHQRVEGRSAGGTRMKVYSEPGHAIEDAQRLAEGMTFKWAAAGLELGGAKAAIHVPPDLGVEARRNLLERYGECVRDLEGAFSTGPDLGTSSEDMDIVAEVAPGLALGRTVDAGGAGDPAPYTALGVLEAMRVVLQFLDGEPVFADAGVIIQGVGNVGAQLAAKLQAEGAKVRVSDIDANVVDACRVMGIDSVPMEAVYETECDIFAPCATGGILRRRNISAMRCRAVAGAANTQLRDPADAERLKDRRIAYAPDFIINCGGAIAITRMELDGWDAERARAATIETVRENLTQVLEAAALSDRSPQALALELVEERIANR
ncbi:MAG: Glu/Leu/Phe/Val dehydrogenase dimerization domain-containing protein [Pseudomonadota bacterium]